MSIRSKLAWTFILLLIFGITAISSYSILFIRDYLLDEGVRQISNDAEWLAVTIRNLPQNEEFETNLNEAARTAGYRLAVFDGSGRLFAAVPFDENVTAPEILEDEIHRQLTDRSNSDPVVMEEADPERLIVYIALDGGQNPARFLQVSQLKDQIYAPIKTIRWIIYTGMFISIGLVILVSIWFARYMSRPILQLEQTARKIAEGEVDKTLHLNRSDEFGTLAESLNRMASRLREDNEQLKNLYEKQNQFFADITHELRNPLHTIAGALEMLQMEELPDQQRKHYLNTALKQTHRIHRLFKDLVTLQRFDSDSYFIEKKECNLAGILTQIFELYYPRAKEKGIELKVDTDSHTVFADPDKIEQVLDNLVSNALKYTNEGSIEICCQQEGDNVKVEVRDSGIGISEEHLNRLFDRFYRTDKARSRDKGGIGLGLSVVKSILDAHGSRIHIESEVGKGSVFSFYLPLVSR
ncbi:MAG: HAMP domain-containing sensor histidine kinase, partial [Balneolaceae bacterium]